MLIATGRQRTIHAPADGSVVGRFMNPQSTTSLAQWPQLRARSTPGGGPLPTITRRFCPGRARYCGNGPRISACSTLESGKVITQARKEVMGAAALLEENAHIGRFEAGYLAPTGALSGGEATSLSSSEYHSGWSYV